MAVFTLVTGPAFLLAHQPLTSLCNDPGPVNSAIMAPRKAAAGCDLVNAEPERRESWDFQGMSTTALYRTEAEPLDGPSDLAEPAAVMTDLGAVLLRITGDIRSLKDLWETMQVAAPCAASQTFDWAQAWAEHVLKRAPIEPVIVVGYTPGGAPLFLWPFEVLSQSGVRVLRWLSQDHANYAMGLFAPEAQALTRSDMLQLLYEVGRRTGTAAALLEAQPVMWEGVSNPFALLPQQRAPNGGYAVALGDFTALYEQQFSKRSRHTLDRKERRLAGIGTVEYGWARSPDDKHAVLDAFFAQKAKQFAAMGVSDIFDHDARAFYRHLALLDDDNPSRLRLGFVKLDGAVLATFNGFLWQDRMEIALSSLAAGETQRQSPGALLLRHEIKEACEAGLAYFDLGVGNARHKDEWCTTEHVLFDSFIPLKPQGLLVTLPRATAARLKRMVKSNRYLWSLAQNLRRRLRGRGA